MQDSFYDNETDSLPDRAVERIWSVSEVSAHVRNLFDAEPEFQFLRVRGEVTNVSKSQAGHVYFGLKDKNGYLKCVAFKSSAMKLKVQPSDGREAIATGRLGVWEAGGSYQLYVDDLADIGYGALWLQFEETRNRLQE
ncbi:MAG: exodeoxyribonuclease VII large subunit, partial [bacterium]